jgi:hypothetical protein
MKEPGEIWRGGPNHGMDNKDILADLDYSEAQIADLYDKAVVAEKQDQYAKFGTSPHKSAHKTPGKPD